MCSVITIPNYYGNGSVIRIYLLNDIYMDLISITWGEKKQYIRIHLPANVYSFLQLSINITSHLTTLISIFFPQKLHKSYNRNKMTQKAPLEQIEKKSSWVRALQCLSRNYRVYLELRPLQWALV